jgi:hypothetical protein
MIRFHHRKCASTYEFGFKVDALLAGTGLHLREQIVHDRYKCVVTAETPVRRSHGLTNTTLWGWDFSLPLPTRTAKTRYLRFRGLLQLAHLPTRSR